MSPNPAETLRILFDLQQKQIDCDLASTADQLDRIDDEVEAYLALPPELQTPDRRALCYHEQMLLGYAAQQQDLNIPEDLRLFLATHPAEQIAEDVCMIAQQEGKLAELGRLMDEIDRREGLSPDEFWPRGEGPRDYQEVENKWEAEFERIRKTVFPYILRRYRLGSIADLYERDRGTYEARREVGRRLRCGKAKPDIDMNKFIADQILRDYGREAYDLLQERLQVADL